MKPVVEVESLSFGYEEQGRLVLDDVSFRVFAGERVGIVGGNGAGKSTLMWCLLGLHKASGTIRIFGEKPRRSLLSRVGVVFQNPEDLLFMPKLIDDLMLPLLNRGLNRDEAHAKAHEALVLMALHGLEGEPARHLSLGQRKRAAIAAALAPEPELLVLDEPTAELDGGSVRRLADHLAALPVACMMTSHDLPFLRRVCSRVLLLLDGRIAADGTPDQVFSDTGLLERAGLI